MSFMLDKKFLVFGRGESAINFLNTFDLNPSSIIGFVESEKSVEKFSGGQLSRFEGKPIFSVNEIRALDFDLIFIANQHYNTLKEVLACGVPIEKIIITTSKVYEEFKREYPSENIRCAFTSVMTQKLQSKTIFSEQFARFDKEVFLFANDYVRIGTIQLLADEIRNRNILGEIAELGVHRGDFAQYLNELFPDRTLNLFDTFDDVAYEESKTDLQAGLISNQTARDLKVVWKDASLKLVMSKMKYPAQVQTYKGFFPSTIPFEEKQFALVSIDVGMHGSTLEGLKYFYPRLSDGGFIMLRCYNDLSFGKSIHKAVEDFELEFGRVVKIPVVDAHGSIIIAK